MLSEAQRKAFVLVPKFMATLSFFGSGVIAGDILRRWKYHRLQLTPRHRLLVGMSICDMFSSFAWFIASWAIPAEISNVSWNKGNWATCEAQGFFIQWSLGTIAYNMSLSLYCLLVIRNSWTEERVSRRVEPWMHTLPWALAVGTGSAGIALDIYNPSGAGWECWIASFPAGCEQSFQDDGLTTCERGEDSNFYAYMFFYVPLWIAIIFVTVTMLMVYLKMRALEKAASRFQQGGGQTRRFAMQALLYVGAFYLTWIFVSLSRLVSQFSGVPSPWELSFVAVFFLPMQGFFNMIVYILPRYQAARRRSTMTVDARSLCAERVAKQAELRAWAAKSSPSLSEESESQVAGGSTQIVVGESFVHEDDVTTQQTSFGLGSSGGSKDSVLHSQTVRCEMSTSGIDFDELLGTKPVCFQGASQRLTNGEECLEGNFDHAGNYLDYEP